MAQTGPHGAPSQRLGREQPLLSPSVSSLVYLVGEVLPDAPLIRASDLARGLVEAAWDRQLLTGNPDPALALDRLPEVLDELCRGLNGEEITVPACIGLRGLALPAGLELPIDGGVLRAPTLSEWHHGDEPDPVALVMATKIWRPVLDELRGISSV